MATMVQIRNVPDEVHRRLKARAALEGKTLSAYLLTELSAIASSPTRAEVLARLAELPPVQLDVDVADLVREDRESH